MGGGRAREVKALRDFGLYYGIAFQMLDDLLDVTADAQALGKPVGNDLQERKITIPLILALKRADGTTRSMVERFYTGKDEQTPAVIEAIARFGGLDGTRKHIAEYAERARISLAPLENTPAKTELARLAGALLAE
jgi:geranylgeranyl pyrophosphate synthase